MIVRDEAEVLERCLDSVAGVADELVVVDTGSVDDTPAIAGRYGAVVLHHDFTDVDFAAARNRGLDRAGRPFVLVIDADEVLDPAGWLYLREYLAAGEDVGYVAARRNHRPGVAGPAPVDHAVRLFPNRLTYRYRHRVHETIDESILAGGGRLRRSGLVLDHYLPAEEAQRAKGEWYLSLLGADVARTPDDADRLAFLAAEYHQLGRYAEATEVAERIAELRPDDFEAQWHAALYHHAYAGDAERTRRDLTAALRLRPDDPEALALLQAVSAR